ncbi:MAG: phosphate ABC transporter substrate-binding protein [Chloroflexi bacterium]|nr:phosphate ABC transporter substrate-binding protein [Chloroflexota bacterium]
MTSRKAAIAFSVLVLPWLLGLALLSCSPRSTPQGEGLSGSFQVKGSDTMVNLGSAWAEEFMRLHPKVRISVTGGGSGTGIAALINKTTDIAQASRSMKGEEYEKARQVGVEPREFVVGMDGLAVVVHPTNPVSELSFEQLSAIYSSGKVTNWKEVGGKDAPMVVLSRDTNSGTHVFFKEHVVQYKDGSLEYGPNVLMSPASKTGVDEVAGNPNAIFYVGLGYVSEKVKPVAIKKEASDKAVLPSVESVKNGTYTLARPLFVYTNVEPQGLLRDYIDWVLGPEGQTIVGDLEFVPLQ